MSVFDYFRSDRAQFEEECRRRTQAAYLGNGTILARCLGRFPMFLDTTDNALAPWLILDGFWESWVTLAAARHVQPGFYCLDLGANQGYFTVLLAALAGPTGRVLAMEPNPRLVELLTRTCLLNGFSGHVTLSPKVAWNATGEELEFVIPPGLSINARVGGPVGEKMRVETTTVDDLTADWPRLDFLKIDVEGAEREVWGGMRKTLTRHPQAVVLMEVNTDRYRKGAADFLRSITEVFPEMRHVDFTGDLAPVTAEEILAQPDHGDWMLWLQR